MRMQTHIWKATSIVRTTEVSSISSGCDSQSAILVFDWLLADSVMNTVKAIVKRLRTATPAGRWKVSFSIKLRLTRRSMINTTVSIVISPKFWGDV